MDNTQDAELALQQLANAYVHFAIEGKEIKIPYILEHARMQFWNTSGKGTPEMIKNELLRTAEYNNFDISNATNFDIYSFMRENRIGIDCSGLAYHLLDAYSKVFRGENVSNHILRYKGVIGTLDQVFLSYKRHRRISAKVLTSDLNSVEIYKVQNIQIGDLIKITTERDHVLVVTKLKFDKNAIISDIEYIHSSSVSTQKRGPHYGHIHVLEPEKGLETQEWLEKTKHDTNYGEDYFKPEKGDSIRRLKAFNTLR